MAGVSAEIQLAYRARSAVDAGRGNLEDRREVLERLRVALLVGHAQPDLLDQVLSLWLLAIPVGGLIVHVPRPAHRAAGAAVDVAGAER